MHFFTVTSEKRYINGLPPGFVNGQRLLYRERRWNYETKDWSKTWTNHVLCLDRKNDEFSKVPSRKISLAMGGAIHIQCNAISVEQSQQVKQEILNNVIKRRYPVENRFEPRVHSLYHAKATTVGVEHDDFTPQPSYSYAGAKMKAYSLSNVPHIKAMYDQVAKICTAAYGDSGEFDHLALEEIENFFNVGVDPICYRDGTDSIGLHADDDQNEDYIVTVVVDCPAGPRKILVQPNQEIMKELKKGQGGDQQGEPPLEQIELFLGARDLYTMDKAMQQNYVHGVPVDKNKAGEGKQRLTIVFRRGREQHSLVDSGVTVNDLTPDEKKAPYLHGPVLKSRDYSADTVTPRIMEPITQSRWADPNETNVFQYGDIVERNVMRDWYGHSNEQGGVSGNKSFGCDSIIISQPRRKGEVSQAFIYKATCRQRAMALVESFHSQHAVRTWRSSSHDRTITLPTRRKQSKVYRYDGLAEIINYKRPQEDSDSQDFCFLMCMMNWDGEKNNDPPDMDVYDQVRLRRCTPAANELLDEVHDLSKLVAELKADPSVRSFRRAEPPESSEEFEGYDVADDEFYAPNDEDSVHEAMQEQDLVLQDPLQDAGVQSGMEESTTTTTTESSSMSSEQASSSRSRKRRRYGSRPSNGPAKSKTKWSAEAKEELLKEVIANADKEFSIEKDRIISRLPRSYLIGEIGVVKYRSKNHVVLVCHPFHVPPSPVREVWLRDYFKGKKTSHAIIYWYGQANKKCMYGYERLSCIKPYGGREKGLVLNKRGRAELEEDLMKNPSDRRRGLADFLEGYQTLGIDDVEETLKDCGED